MSSRGAISSHRYCPPQLQPSLDPGVGCLLLRRKQRSPCSSSPTSPLSIPLEPCRPCSLKSLDVLLCGLNVSLWSLCQSVVLMCDCGPDVHLSAQALRGGGEWTPREARRDVSRVLLLLSESRENLIADKADHADKEGTEIVATGEKRWIWENQAVSKTETGIGIPESRSHTAMGGGPSPLPCVFFSPSIRISRFPRTPSIESPMLHAPKPFIPTAFLTIAHSNLF